jgi:hypothetical protein
VDFSRRRHQRYGTVGKLLEAGQVVYEAGDSTVRVTLDDGTVIEAFNNKVQRARVDVIVEPGKGGIWRIIDVQEAISPGANGLRRGHRDPGFVAGRAGRGVDVRLRGELRRRNVAIEATRGVARNLRH